MTRLREFLLTGAALGLLGIGGVGCTGQGADSAAAPPSGPAATSPAAPTASAPSDGDADVTAQEKRVKAALDTVDPDAPEFVESGTERVADGVHHRSHLTKGVAYRLTLVCAGEGVVVPVVGGEEIPAVPDVLGHEGHRFIIFAYPGSGLERRASISLEEKRWTTSFRAHG